MSIDLQANLVSYLNQYCRPCPCAGLPMLASPQWMPWSSGYTSHWGWTYPFATGTLARLCPRRLLSSKKDPSLRSISKLSINLQWVHVNCYLILVGHLVEILRTKLEILLHANSPVDSFLFRNDLNCCIRCGPAPWGVIYSLEWANCYC